MSTQDRFTESLATRSSYVENVLVHGLLYDIASRLWSINPSLGLHIFNSEVDDSGFDLVLGIGSALRYIQIKQVYDEGQNTLFSVREEFARVAGGCVVVIVHGKFDLSIKHYLFYGSELGSPMPSIADFKNTTIRGKVRVHYRKVPRTRFSGPLNGADLLTQLFGDRY